MTELSAETLIAAIQAVDVAMQSLVEEEPDMKNIEPDHRDMYLSLWKAAMELKDAYLLTCADKPDKEYPAYAELVSDALMNIPDII